MTIEEAIKRHVGPCGHADCHRLLIPGNVWKELSLPDRESVREMGYAGHSCRGLCIKHAGIATREGTLQEYSQKPKKTNLTAEQVEAMTSELEALPCVGPDCSKKIVPKRRWLRIPVADRLALAANGLACHETRSLCYSCCGRAKADGTLETYPESTNWQQRPISERFDIPKMWAELKEEGGTIAELAGQLGVTPERTRQLFKQLGVQLPPHGNALRQVAKLEEIEFLHSCGMGVHEMAGKMGMTDTELIEYVRGRRQVGATKLDLQYADRVEQVDLMNA